MAAAEEVQYAECAALEEKSGMVLQQLRTSPTQRVDGVSPEELTPLYTLPPHIPKSVWTELGDLIKVTCHGCKPARRS